MKKTEQEIVVEKDNRVILQLIVVGLAAFVWLSGFFSLLFRVVYTGSLVFSFVVARMGADRKIGYSKALLASSLFSPILGLIITISSPRLDDQEYKEKMLEVAETKSAGPSSIADQLHKLNELRKEGVLTDAEFERQKEKLLNS